jgi:hypothetical protein
MIKHEMETFQLDVPLEVDLGYWKRIKMIFHHQKNG